MAPYRAIMMTMGYFILILSCIMIITFFVWVIKLEFSWFFGINIFKTMKKKSNDVKWKLVKLLKKTKDEIDKANDDEPIIVKKNVRLNEDILD